MRILDVYLHNELAGYLKQDASGAIFFKYDDVYIKSQKLPISVLMPLRKEAYDGVEVKSFFSGLLPDDNLRNKLAKNFGVSDKNPFALLEAVGWECAGALRFITRGQDFPSYFHKNIKANEELYDKKLLSILSDLKNRPLFADGDDGVRLSLAGAQNKIVVGVEDNKIFFVRNNEPTTHIIKPKINDLEDTVFNEFFCMKLASLVGIEVPKVEVRKAENQHYFMIERYDRKQIDDGSFVRLHQEDFCQASGTPPELKYENEGGVGIAKSMELIKEYSAQPASDQWQFLKRVIFNYIIGNNDAHSKNFAFLYKSNRPILAPSYDILCTEVYEGLAKKMAMKIGSKYKPYEVLLRHWYGLVADVKTAQSSLGLEMFDLLAKVNNEAVRLKIDLNDSDLHSPIYDKVISVISKRSQMMHNILNS
jgi:serine/threonine-protein kinase HipA